MSLIFDMPSVAIQSYKTIWTERHYISKLLVVPVIVKFLCLVAVLFSGASNDAIRQCLIMLPSFFLEGWLVAQFLRTYLTGERWPYPVDLTSIENEVAIIRRVRALLACIICFVLTKMGLALLENGMMGVMRDTLDGASEVSDPQNRITVILALITIVLFFRLLWAPIAFVANVSLKDFIEITKGFLPTFQLFAIFLIVTIPIAILSLIVLSLIIGTVSAGSDPNFLTLCGIAFIGAFRDIFASLVPMIAIAIILKPHLKIS